MALNIDKVVLAEGIALVHDHLKAKGASLLYLAVSGSHVWGLERPDSDIDFRGVYQVPTVQTMGLEKGRDTVELTEGIYDVQLYEVEKFLNMLCNHNGNMVNLLYYPRPAFASFVLPWVWLSKSFTTRKLRNYYRGYAEGQRKRAMSQRGGKALIYTYREMFSGLWTMHYGYPEHNFMKLWDEAKAQGWYDGALLGKYFPDPNQPVSDEGWHQFYAEWAELCTALDRESAMSSLPETFDGREQCSHLLQQLRLHDLHTRATNG